MVIGACKIEGLKWYDRITNVELMEITKQIPSNREVKNVAG